MPSPSGWRHGSSYLDSASCSSCSASTCSDTHSTRYLTRGFGGAEVAALLEVRDLTIEFTTKAGIVHAVEGASFDVERGEALGLAGESGCGKTTTALALMRLLPYNGRIVRGSISFAGRSLVPLEEASMRAIRLKEMSMFVQDAKNSRNPVQRLERQLAELDRLRDGAA